MVTAVIVQARYGSTRLPGKIIKPLGIKNLGVTTPLYAVLSRCSRIPEVDIVVCAVPDTPENDPIEAEARSAGAVVTRGPEADVLARYHLAARAVGADTVMRVTSDCPLIDPLVCSRVLQALSLTGADYASNNMPPLWPHGLDCEAFPARHLATAMREATAPHDREHVTPWLRRNPSFQRVSLDGPGGGRERHRWTLDYPEDFALFEALWAATRGTAATMDFFAVADFLDNHPEITAINRHLIDPARLAADSPPAERRIAFDPAAWGDVL